MRERERGLFEPSGSLHDQQSMERRGLSSIRPGNRVTMSKLGRRRHPRYAGLEGTIVGRSAYPSSVRVKFEGRIQVETFHRDYLELVESSDARAASEVVTCEDR